MVWFQCEDCGENLKKPKLLNHFNRCSAYKLSCIDCGVVFDRQTVQAHTSCVTEGEKYGPKGSSGGARVQASANGKEMGSDVDVSRGLSTFPPWSCSLCNVKTTSSETLEQHSQGRKHRSKVKSAAAKEEKSVTEGGAESMAITNGACKRESENEKAEEAASEANACILQATEEKRKKERAHKPEKLREDMSNKAIPVAVGTAAATAEAELRDSGKKKRKHVEEQQKHVPAEDERASGKKSRKKDRINGHDSSEPTQPSVAECSGGKRNKVNVPLEKGVGDINGASVGVKDGLSARDPKVATNGGATGSEGMADIDMKVKKLRALRNAEQNGVVDATGTKDKGQKYPTKGKQRKSEMREPSVHEVSFREWLGGEGGGAREDVPSQSAIKGNENLQQQQRMQRTMEAIRKLETATTEPSHNGVAKAVKWKKIIREVLAKLIASVSGRVKKKELTRAVLPLAIESSASVDRKALKAELLRRISSSPKFVVDGKHIMLSPTLKST